MSKLVLCFGNELLEQDSIAIKIKKQLENELNNIEFKFCKNPEDIMLEAPSKEPSRKSLFFRQTSEF